MRLFSVNLLYRCQADFPNQHLLRHPAGIADQFANNTGSNAAPHLGFVGVIGLDVGTLLVCSSNQDSIRYEAGHQEHWRRFKNVAGRFVQLQLENLNT